MLKGNKGRLPRSRSLGQRRILLGNYLIVTDTEGTERNYLLGLRNSLPENIREHIRIKVIDGIPTSKLVEKAENERAKAAQYCELWIVFDRDRVPNFDAIIAQATAKGIRVGWSNPCIEIWFLAYFGSMPTVADSTQCVARFREKLKQKAGVEYSKAAPNIYDLLKSQGDETVAFTTAEARLKVQSEKKPSKMDSATTLHHLVQEIQEAAH